LALSTRFRKSYVWLGAAAALLAQVFIAVTAGHFMTLLPHRLLALVVGLLFLLGAGLLIFQKDGGEVKRPKFENGTHGFIKVFTTSFIVIFLSEWGDITQIVTANYAAKYHDALGVGIGATAALWTVAALGVLLGSKLIKRVPGQTLQRAAAVILFIFAIISLTVAFR